MKELLNKGKFSARVRQARKFMLEESKRIPDWKSLRITFFFARPTTGPNPEDRNFTQLGQFAKYYEKLPDTTSTLILTSNEPAPNATASVSCYQWKEFLF